MINRSLCLKVLWIPSELRKLGVLLRKTLATW